MAENSLLLSVTLIPATSMGESNNNLYDQLPCNGIQSVSQSSFGFHWHCSCLLASFLLSVVTGVTCLQVACALRFHLPWYYMIINNTSILTPKRLVLIHFLFSYFCFVEFTGWCSDAGGCQAHGFRPQRQCFWTRWSKGHWESAKEFHLLHTAGATAQQLWHGHRRWQGKCGDDTCSWIRSSLSRIKHQRWKPDKWTDAS